MSKELTALAESRPVASLSRLEKAWLRRRYCGWCEAWALSARCGAQHGKHILPIIEGVRDQEEIVDLGPPCDMDERRAKALQQYKPRALRQRLATLRDEG